MPRTGWRKRLTLLVLLFAVGAAAWWLRDRVSLEQIIPYENRLRSLVADRPVASGGAAFLIYVLFVGLSLPGASVLTPLVGWLFGFWKGLLFASFASTAGATMAFLLSRYFLRDIVQRRWADRLTTVNAALDREGAYYLFTLRLVPAFPFFLINLLMGLTRIRTSTYWWVSQVGMLPGTCLFVFAGAAAPTLWELSQSKTSLFNWRLLAALIAFGLLPLVLRALIQKSRHRRLAESSDAGLHLPLSERNHNQME